MPKKTVVVIGLGLMGGSLALSLKRKSKRFRIFGISRSRTKIRRAIRRKIIDAGSVRIQDIPSNASAVVIATPVPNIVPLVKQIEKSAKHSVLVTDVGSTKHLIHKMLKNAKLKKVDFIGSHPMCGDHATGLAAARKKLYDKSLVFVTADTGKKESIRKIASLWREAGADRIIILQAKEHDKIVGEISHLPHLISSILTLCASPKNIRLSGPGFKDATRIAQGDAGLWTGIIASNPELSASLKKFEKVIRDLRTVIEKKKWLHLKKLLSASSLRRRTLNTQ